MSKINQSMSKIYRGWHIDHKIPKSAFNFETPEDIDFKRCWALKNLQPLWAAENIKKHDRVDKPFQPSLAIGGVKFTGSPEIPISTMRI